MTRARCPGSGARWTTGTGSPICPVCHAGWRTLSVRRPPFKARRGSARVPPHDRTVA